MNNSKRLNEAILEENGFDNNMNLMLLNNKKVHLSSQQHQNINMRLSHPQNNAYISKIFNGMCFIL